MYTADLLFFFNDPATTKIYANLNTLSLHDALPIFLNAPCVPQRHHKQWLDQIHFAQHIYVHYNPKDHVLAGAHLISLTRQLGEKLHRPLSSRAMYINFNTIAGKNHSNFLVLLQHPVPPQAALDYYYVLLHGNAVEISDTTFFRPSVYKSIGADLVR